jgi:hypothetical protein
MIGIIPCAGKATRWGGNYKELLPIGENKWLIDCSIDQMYLSGVRKFCIVSNPEKISTHIQHFQKDKYKGICIFFVIQNYNQDILGAIKTALPFCEKEDFVFFSMPDTLFGEIGFNVNPKVDFNLGVFNTINGNRFGVLDQEPFKTCKIINKNEDFVGINKLAWGNFVANWKVIQFWYSWAYVDSSYTYTDLLNSTIKMFSYDLHTLDYYYDFENWDEYKRWINEK